MIAASEKAAIGENKDIRFPSRPGGSRACSRAPNGLGSS
jgi:hypothetical protein